MTTSKGDDPLVAGIIVFGLQLCSVEMLSGYSGTPETVESTGATEAFRIRLVRGVKATSDTLGFDPELPGYHLRVGSGTIELHRKSEMGSDQLVLEICTSPGVQPNLESFTLG